MSFTIGFGNDVALDAPLSSFGKKRNSDSKVELGLGKEATTATLRCNSHQLPQLLISNHTELWLVIALINLYVLLEAGEKPCTVKTGQTKNPA